MSDWLSIFKYNPIKPLLESGHETIIYFTERDLLDEKVDPIDYLWNLPEVQKIVKKQVTDGSWPPKNKTYANFGVKYSLIETWKQLRILIQ